MEQDVYNNPDVQYDSYLEPDADPFVQQILATTAITSINGVSGPTVTFSGGVSGFTFVPGGTTITLLSPLTAKGDLYTRNSTTGVALPVGTNTFVLSANSGTATGLEWIANATGTVTSVSVVTANGFAGTVATATTTPAITLTTTISGVLKGNGTAISAAASADIITALGYTPTDAAVVPSTAPSAGQILVGNAGNTAYAKQTVSGSGATITLASTGVMTISGIANASLTNSSITINGTSVALGGTRTLTLASADFVNQGTTSTVLHGNAAGNPSFAAVSLTADVSGVLPVANGGVDQTAWSSWTVTWTNVDVTTAPAATVVAKYKQIGKSVFARLSLVLGAGSTVTGLVIFSLPVTSVSYAGTASVQPLGFATAYDSGSNVYVLIPVWISTTTAAFVVARTSGTYATQDAVTGTVPFTFGTSDEINCEFFYEAA